MKKSYLLLVFALCIGAYINAQERYVDEVFEDSELVIMKDVLYAKNMDFLPVIFPPNLDAPVVKDLFVDIYMPDPEIDDEDNRPVIVIPAGTLNPRYVQNCYGNKDDLQHTSFAPRLAKTGYVVVVADMRQGWNPLVTTPNDFLTQLADASIRQIQDMHSLSRFLQITEAEVGNPYEIDTDKMIIWGISNGPSTVAIATVYAERTEEFQTPAYIVIDPDTGMPVNVYDPVLFGAVNGTEPGFTEEGAISNIAVNNGCYDTDFKMVVSSGGVSLDTVLMEEGEPPLINFVAENYVTTPFEFGPLNLPVTMDFCCLVYFGHTLVRINDDLGNNDAWKDVEFIDPIANNRFDYGPNPDRMVEGIYHVSQGDPSVSYPWIWYDEAMCEAVDPDVLETTADGLMGNSQEQMDAIHEEMIRYSLPRACITLDLGCEGIIPVAVQEPIYNTIVSIAPNPSSGSVMFTSPEDDPMQRIQIFNIAGSLVAEFNVDHHQFSTGDMGLANGLYIAKIKFEEGIMSKKLTIQE